MTQTDYEIRFQSLFNTGCALCFPCDEKGCVDLDDLPPVAMENYLFARATVGRDFSAPRVVLHEHA